ncbi:iron-sulfur cluster assembly protein [Halocatena marina]|uniref:Iron-sulfur cluster assembly protein n=1 Tax=Halocatena marina TaxID=2934937 RepID=A0ABD5YUA6_9EURY|nr:iron-sulfur cluster assembly protein [Halocatena marina]
MSQSVSSGERAVLDRLDRVTDPELDRSIVELDYIDELRVDSSVFVQFKLPTAWCSPAFAWMMATDIREEVQEVSDVDRVTVKLVDHMHAAEITRGVNEERPFEAVFEDATEGVEAARAMLDSKARLARQYHAVNTLLDAGLEPTQIVALTRNDIAFDDAAERAAISVADGLTIYAPLTPLAEYVEKARETGVLSAPDERLFVTADGEPIAPEAFDRVHHRTRAAKTNMTGQGAVCDALHNARYGESE